MAYTLSQNDAVRRVLRCNNYYEILCVDECATTSDIKKAFRKLALVLHPDKNNAPGSTEAFRTIGMVTELLADANRRQKYDRELRETRAKEFVRQAEEMQRRKEEEQFRKQAEEKDRFQRKFEKERASASNARSYEYNFESHYYPEQNTNQFHFYNRYSTFSSDKYNNSNRSYATSSNGYRSHNEPTEESSKRFRSSYRHRSDGSRSRNSSCNRESHKNRNSSSRNERESTEASSKEEQHVEHISIPTFFAHIFPLIYLLLVSLMSSYLIMGCVKLYFSK